MPAGLGPFTVSVRADILSCGAGDLEARKKRPGISILVAFFIRTFVVGGEEGKKS